MFECVKFVHFLTLSCCLVVWLCFAIHIGQPSLRLGRVLGSLFASEGYLARSSPRKAIQLEKSRLLSIATMRESTSQRKLYCSSPMAIVVARFQRLPSHRRAMVERGLRRVRIPTYHLLQLAKP